jgi:uncharacterized membrane protein YgdD (TMEM256/DUF423 family)
MNKQAKQLLTTAAIFGLLSVMLGAFAAHGLKKTLSDYSIGIFETGVKYQFYHCFALLTAGLLSRENSSKALFWAGRFFIIGFFLFSGSLYLLAILSQHIWLGMITPIGGLSFMAGWGALLWHIRKS